MKANWNQQENIKGMRGEDQKERITEKKKKLLSESNSYFDRFTKLKSKL